MSLKRLIAGSALFALCSGCGTDEPTSVAPLSTTPLSTAEFNAMVDALVAAHAFGSSLDLAVFATDPAVPAHTARTLAAQMSEPFTIDQIEECPGGGTVRVDGTGTQNYTGEQSGTITMYLHLTFNGCRAAAPDGQVFTFEGNPALNLALDATFAPGTMTMLGHDSGSFRWSANGKSGTCPFNVLVSITSTALSTTGRATGEICGAAIDETF